MLLFTEGLNVFLCVFIALIEHGDKCVVAMSIICMVDNQFIILSLACLEMRRSCILYSPASVYVQ